ncbi:NTP transferase domain-containing protein [Marinobacterium stanieri]|uniref:Molybdenum cofactor guanylyltransferase n=1 Tax=Marinobacterium stanieri TaxID=49186 RepID=A0A1N6NQM5_9GAMM|nr:NTP transferase domain-containing protein [Marinobacterium stanieri]SIP94405.1 molybdenum cofactor guanylyltransferase [Marinobacterium stanieri]
MITGLVLSGGRGERVDGADKGLMLHEGLPRVQYSIEALRPHCDQLYLNCNRNHDQYERFGLPLLSEPEPDFPGALVALSQLLPELPGDQFLILPCDTPGIRADHINLLLEAAEQYPEHWIYFISAGREHPLHALIPEPLVPQLVRRVAAGERQMIRVLQQVKSVGIKLRQDVLLNLNT